MEKHEKHEIKHSEIMDELREQFKPILENSTDGVYLWMSDEDKICNEKLAKMFGLTTKEWELERSKQSLDYYTSIKDRNIGNNIFTEIQPKTGMPYKLISDLKNERIFMIFANITELDQILSTFQFAN